MVEGCGYKSVWEGRWFMAKVRSNVVVRGLSGKFGDQMVYRQMKDGRTIVAKMPDFSSRVLSPKQEEKNERFRQAVAYAKPASKKEPLYAELAAGTAKNAYNVALGDWLNPPVIQRVDIAGDVIRILAHDDVRVVGVRVTIFDGEGKVLEQGEAVLLDGDQWEYRVSSSTYQVSGSTYRVIVEARDLPGNVTRRDEG